MAQPPFPQFQTLRHTYTLPSIFGARFRWKTWLVWRATSKTTRSDSSPSSLTLARIGRIFEWNRSPWPAATPRPSCLGRLRWTHHKRERKRDGFFHSISLGGLAGDRRDVVPASGFSFSAQQIWKVIRENKDLDLPAHKVMVATVRCEEIANQKFKQMVHDEGWLALQEAVETGPVQGFGKRLSSILATYLSEYDMEAIYFDEGVRNSKRQLLESKALDFVYPVYSAMLGHLRFKALEDFQVRLEQSLNKGEGFSSSVLTCAQSSMLEFEKGCADAAIQQASWDASKVREKLRRDVDAHASSVRSAKLAELNSNYEKKTFFVFKWSCRSSTQNWCKRHLGFDTKTT